MTPKAMNFVTRPSGLHVPRAPRLIQPSDPEFSRASRQSLECWGLEQLAREQRAKMFDGPFWNDLREPFIVSDLAAVALTTTAKALYTPSAFPVLGGQYWTRYGKALQIRLFGKMTTAATPGNGSFNVYYGDGTDANGVILMTGTAVALTLNKTALSWWAQIDIRCITTGSAGTLECCGIAHFNVGLIASTLQPIMLPDNTLVPSGACDLTAAKIISVQYLRSGSTVETMTVQNLQVVAMN